MAGAKDAGLRGQSPYGAGLQPAGLCSLSRGFSLVRGRVAAGAAALRGCASQEYAFLAHVVGDGESFTVEELPAGVADHLGGQHQVIVQRDVGSQETDRLPELPLVVGGQQIK